MENVASTFQKNRIQNTKKKITWKNVNNEKSERAPRRTKILTDTMGDTDTNTVTASAKDAAEDRNMLAGAP